MTDNPTVQYRHRAADSSWSPWLDMRFDYDEEPDGLNTYYFQGRSYAEAQFRFKPEFTAGFYQDIATPTTVKWFTEEPSERWKRVNVVDVPAAEG